MIILKHVEYKIRDSGELERLLNHLRETTSKVDGVECKDIYFPKGKDEYVLVMLCLSEDKYRQWRDICPPSPGANDWYEVLLTKKEYLSGLNEGGKNDNKQTSLGCPGSSFANSCPR